MSTVKSFIPLILLTNLILAQTHIDGDLINRISSQLIQKEKIIAMNFPEYTENGSWVFRKSVNWFSGFLSGELWQIYDVTGKKELKELALAQADNLIRFAGIDNTHDMGFIFYPSCVRAYYETGDTKYLNAALKAAEMLAKRFNKNGNFIRAWGSLKDPERAGWMIIDTMMNLELLFWAAKESGNTDYYDIAYKHALTTLKEAVRSNYSSYHLIEFDTSNGNVLNRRTHQGFADSSTWARGQAWGIYGFASTYKNTGDERFLLASSKMADYFLSNLDDDLVPVWDLDLNNKPDELRDASAGAITASGLFLLSELSNDKESSDKYLNYAAKITQSLMTNYLFISSKREKEEGILLHTIYHKHNKWGVDESFPAGDYYFMEAFTKLWKYINNVNFIKDDDSRHEYLINSNWFYIEDNTTEAGELDKSAMHWQKVTLPHTWNKFDATDLEPGYRRDAGWYQKFIYVPQLKNNRKLQLHFEGVNIISKVYVNGQFAGGHTGGYLGFYVDITPFIRMGEKNEILVRVDNSVNHDIIPSQKSDFFIYGGINRDVWLKVLPASYLHGCKISSPKIDEEKASTEVIVFVDSNADQELEIKISVKDTAGKTVASSSLIKYFTEGLTDKKLELPKIIKPRLWSPDNPNLYSVNVELWSGNKLIDQITEKFGYRWFEFRSHGAFYLNGERILIRGTHWHEDYAGLGNAVPDSLKEKDFRLIKSMGANFVRLAHYPQDPIVYKLCDELGLLVWDELPWCRGGIGSDTWKRNTKLLLAKMIMQNFNHPSIIIWSLGNEINWLPDFPEGDNNDSLRAFLVELNSHAKYFDSSRLTAIRKYNEASDIVDVISPSIWAGWYSGVYTNYQKAIESAQKNYPHVLHMEYGGDSHIGRHTENPINGNGLLSPDEWEENIQQIKISNIANMGDWSESYIVDLFDWYLRYSETSETLTGNAQWAFKDFGTPLRPENPIPYVNQKGLVDRAGNPKDAFYVFKSYWNKIDKFCYIQSHSSNERSGPENLKRELNVFSNCQSAELFLNGQSLGLKNKNINSFPASGFNWQVNFPEGVNQLKAIGYENDKAVTSDSIVVNYSFQKAGSPDKIELSADRLSNGNYIINAVVVDKNNKRCLDYNKRIYFSVSGSGKLFENYGTPRGSSVIEASSGKAQIEFKRVGYNPVTIEARNQDLKGDYLVIEN